MDKIILYGSLLDDIKKRIQRAQAKAVLAINAVLILMYWDIGRIIAKQQVVQGWSSGVTPRLAIGFSNEPSEHKGFSEGGYKLMVPLHKEYEGAIGKQVVSQIPWGHHIFLIVTEIFRCKKNQISPRTV